MAINPTPPDPDLSELDIKYDEADLDGDWADPDAKKSESDGEEAEADSEETDSDSSQADAKPARPVTASDYFVGLGVLIVILALEAESCDPWDMFIAFAEMCEALFFSFSTKQHR